MQQIGYDEMEALGKALSHTKRVGLLRLVAVRGALSAGELTGLLGLSGGAVTGHIRALEQARLVRVEDANGVHGVKRMVSLRQDRLLRAFGCAESVQDGYEVALPIGGYVSHREEPTCGLALRSGLIGQLDDPRYFDDPRHFQAGVLWILAGQLTYNIPNYVLPWAGAALYLYHAGDFLRSTGTCADWPSRLTFSLCGVELGQWVSPGDYGDRRGLCNPSWWSDSLNQYGLLKTLTVTPTAHSWTVSASAMRRRISCPSAPVNPSLPAGCLRRPQRRRPDPLRQRFRQLWPRHRRTRPLRQ